MSTFVQLDPAIEFKAYETCSVFDCTTTTFRILIYAGNKQYYLQVIHQRTKFWKVCVYQNYRSLLSLRQYWHCTTRKRFEVEDYHRLRKCVKLHVDQTLRNKNFKIQSPARSRRKVVLKAQSTQRGQMGSNASAGHTVKFLRGTWHQKTKSGKKRAISRNHPKV